MVKRKAPSPRDWFDNCGGWRPRHNLDELRCGMEAGLLNAQDEYGMGNCEHRYNERANDPCPSRG
jgi:hypothetical protein